jgi:hypothetical protein
VQLWDPQILVVHPRHPERVTLAGDVAPRKALAKSQGFQENTRALARARD